LLVTRDLGGQIAFITGASSGIGEALARELARQGADVALLARRTDRLTALAAEIAATGRRTVAVSCDVTSDADVVAAVARVRAVLGTPSIVIANAGFGVSGTVETLSIDDYRRQFETNVFGVLRTVHATLPDLKATRGRLVIIGSVAGYVCTPGASAYAMSKASMTALAQGLRRELRSAGVSVTLISPGFVDSEIRQVDNAGRQHPHTADPVPQWIRMRSDVAARHIVRAVARRRREAVITAHGKAIVFVQRHAPWVLDLVLRAAGVRNRPEPGTHS
jgi:short-subunit dehydrogenase